MGVFHTIRRFLPSPDRDARRTHHRTSSSLSSTWRTPLSRSPRFILHPCFPCTLRRILVSLTLILLLLILLRAIPPSYNDIREYERRLPQHNLSLAPPEGVEGAYLRFPGHLWGHGLNNVLQETILMSYLAYMTNRSFVFEDYTWSHTPLPWTISLRPKRIPLNAFISGPTAGGPIPPYSASSSPQPRAISAEWWEKVCPKSRRIVVSSSDAPGGDVEADKLMEWWIDKLASVQGSCVEVDSSEKVVFDLFLFGSPRILSIWPSLSSSPILSSYAWSPLVQSAVARNFAILHPLSSYTPSTPHSSNILQGLVAVHLRRGDFERHCSRLATWNSKFMGLNQFPSLLDKFDPESELPSSVSPKEKKDFYLKHCLPSYDQIRAKLHTVREENPGLRRVYLLTNGWWWWLNGLKGVLKGDGWDEMVTSSDIKLDDEQGHVAVAVDMAIAEKAEVFVGNGFSSLSSNIVMLRMAKGLDPSSNRFL